MADLIFFTGPMDCGKSTLSLQIDYTQSRHERIGRRFTYLDRSGESKISSRLGLEADAVEVVPTFNFWSYVVDELTAPRRIDYLICDEAQFYTPDQIEQLSRIVDDLQLDVFAFGILADFRTELFPGSKRLVELADRIEPLQVSQLCWCGSKGTHNARVVNGVMAVEGSQVVVGDTGADDTIRYEVVCRAHHRRRMTKQRAQAVLHPDVLPFEANDTPS